MDTIFTASLGVGDIESIKLEDTTPAEVSNNYLEEQGRKLARWLKDNASDPFMKGFLLEMHATAEGRWWGECHNSPYLENMIL